MKFSDSGRMPAGSDPSAALDNLQVCMVHRPRYDDWSWPKGKLEANESHRHAAVREMGEETGLCLALGPVIGEVDYPMDREGKKSRGSKKGKAVKTDQAEAGTSGTSKHVIYWMARVLDPADADRSAVAFGPISQAGKDEVDQVLWLSVADARRKLSHSLDRDILDSFVDRVQEGALESACLLMVRHGKALGRKVWEGQEGARPLTPKGAAYSYALSREIACYQPTRLVSSPWTRCMQTIAPYSWMAKEPVVEAEDLTEDTFAANAKRSWDCLLREIDGLLDPSSTPGRTTAICMHRPVIGGVFQELRKICSSKSLAKRLHASSPYMPTGNALAIFIIMGAEGPRIIDIQKVGPIVF
ncbi:DNA mismatch repair protein MutT [Bifidobacterium aemilianum]|uniref:DNA mismatch repair protein MutT n=2 Tax=Bifidobacterium aemilianum TaxID=2493120 RepID=A0A366K812_9BIFI|nr:DNA mismatch repair protein MutT [Bifidobacterium aemilianum]